MGAFHKGINASPKAVELFLFDACQSLMAQFSVTGSSD